MIRKEYIRWLEKKDKNELITMLVHIKYIHLCRNCRYYNTEDNSCLSLMSSAEECPETYSCNEFKENNDRQR